MYGTNTDSNKKLPTLDDMLAVMAEGKLSPDNASEPFKQSNAASYALAAASAVEYDPSQILVLWPGALISETHEPQLRILTPLNGPLATPFLLLVLLFSPGECVERRVLVLVLHFTMAVI